MKVFWKAGTVALFAFVISRMCGCTSSSTLVDKWHDPSFQAPPLGNILVIAAGNDATKRRIREDAFSGELAKHDMAATSSYYSGHDNLYLNRSGGLNRSIERPSTRHRSSGWIDKSHIKNIALGVIWTIPGCFS